MKIAGSEIKGSLFTFSTPINMVKETTAGPSTSSSSVHMGGGVSGPTIELSPPNGSTQVKYAVTRSAGTLKLRARQPMSLVVLAVPSGVEIDGWRLNSTIIVQIRRTAKETLATTWLEGVAEYGVGRDEIEAVRDLIRSLGEYRESLDRRERKLGDSAKKELAYLRKLVEPLA